MTSVLKKVNATADSDDLAAQVETLRQDLATLTHSISDLGKAKGDAAVNAAKAKMADVRDQAADTAETARLHAMELQGQADTFIKNQPAAALGIAAGVGFLVGFLGSRK